MSIPPKQTKTRDNTESCKTMCGRKFFGEASSSSSAYTPARMMFACHCLSRKDRNRKKHTENGNPMKCPGLGRKQPCIFNKAQPGKPAQRPTGQTACMFCAPGALERAAANKMAHGTIRSAIAKFCRNKSVYKEAVRRLQAVVDIEVSERFLPKASEKAAEPVADPPVATVKDATSSKRKQTRSSSEGSG